MKINFKENKENTKIIEFILTQYLQKNLEKNKEKRRKKEWGF